MSFYSNTKEASLSRKGVYLSENEPIGTKHKFKVNIDVIKETPPGGHGAAGDIIEFTVLESTCTKNPVGSRAGHFINMSSFPKLGLGEVMKFTCALLGGDPRVEEEVRFLARGKLMQWIFDATQNKPLLDQKDKLIMTIDTHVSMTKKGGPFTHYNYAKNENPPDIEAIVQSLGLMNDL